jgi:hypothetical protein
MDEWAASGRAGIPVLTLPDTPTATEGRCVSCGCAIMEGWRCETCLHGGPRRLRHGLGAGRAMTGLVAKALAVVALAILAVIG